MMNEKGYLFISNSNKPTEDIANSVTPVPVSSFSESCLFAAKELGFKIYCGISRNKPELIRCSTPGYEITYYNQHIYRNIFALKDNWIAYKNACDFLEVHPEIEVIHCNTPIGGVIGRLVGNKFKKKVFYTAHGFHFYKGAPLINWILFYPIEKFLARYTDVLITINSEDFEIAKNFRLKRGGRVYHVPGVGVDLDKFKSSTDLRSITRKKLGLEDKDIMLISMGDLVARKNTQLALKAIKAANDNRLHYFICGNGPQMDELKKMAKKMNIDNQVHFLGRRSDIKELVTASDIFLFTSKQEGLPRSLMEAMAIGLPCLVTKIRGNIDLIEQGKGGYLYEIKDYEGFAKGIKELADNPILRKKMGNINLHTIKNFDLISSRKAFEYVLKDSLSKL